MTAAPFDGVAGGIAIVAVSRPGAALARRLAHAAPFQDAELHLERRAAGPAPDENRPPQLYDLPLRPVLQNLFRCRRALVVFLPVGAAVRLLAPALDSKRRDAAVVCVDDGGRYAVSVLSGHQGGADALARQVATALGAQAVITSASEALSVPALDLVGQRQGWRIEAAPADLTRAAAAVVNGEPVALWQDAAAGAPWPDDIPLSDNIVPVSDFADAVSGQYAAALAVSDRILDTPNDAADPPLVTYRPPTLAAGIGCRRGVPETHLRRLLSDTMRQHGFAMGSLAKLATADLKADEDGIIALAQSLGIPLAVYAGAELDAAGRAAANLDTAGTDADGATPSAAQELLGIFGVAEPAALLAAGARHLLVPRTRSDRATVAIARIPPPPHQHHHHHDLNRQRECSRGNP